ncbi:MAG: DUF1353 domain-containing protein [Myxococcales bacterium]|nr:DUF1353 domain-containing protein [Myxococcales bacterium]
MTSLGSWPRISQLKYKKYTIRSAPPRFTALPESHEFELIDDFYFKIESPSHTSEHRIPKGFSFDSASIPRPFWSIVYGPYHPHVVRASLIHDYFYYTHTISRKEADDTFIQVLYADHVPTPRAILMWLGVRLFGRRYWRNASTHVEKLQQLGIDIPASAAKPALTPKQVLPTAPSPTQQPLHSDLELPPITQPLDDPDRRPLSSATYES